MRVASSPTCYTLSTSSKRPSVDSSTSAPNSAMTPIRGQEQDITGVTPISGDVQQMTVSGEK